MLKLIKCEFYKFKRRSLFVLATLVALVFPIVMTALYWNIPTQVNYDNLFSGIVDYGDFLLLLPILVVIATSLFFTETDNDTLKNLTTIPVSKGKIVVAKIGVMAIISVSYTLLGFFASMLCSKILGIAMENMAQKFVLSIGLGIMLLAAALPCVALVVWFNKSDLISIVITLFYTIINYHLLIDQPLLSGIVMLDAVIIIVHAATAHISRSSNSRSTGTTADDFGLHMINCHIWHLLSMLPATADKALGRAHEPRRGYHCLIYQVVSKCALRE